MDAFMDASMDKVWIETWILPFHKVMRSVGMSLLGSVGDMGGYGLGEGRRGSQACRPRKRGGRGRGRNYSCKLTRGCTSNGQNIILIYNSSNIHSTHHHQEVVYFDTSLFLYLKYQGRYI